VFLPFFPFYGQKQLSRLLPKHPQQNTILWVEIGIDTFPFGLLLWASFSYKSRFVDS
jgi:hypothetical protein